MKNFTERHHAFISAMFYKLLIEKFNERGEKAFILATQRYAEQRGSRMAQRAIRDGKELDFKTYMEYGEWSFTKETLNEIKSLGIEKQMEVISYSPHYEYNVYACPWSMQYKEMGLLEGACVYCSHLDNSIARGFNPYLDFKTTQTIHKTTHCNFILKEAEINKDDKLEKDEKNMKSFEYHCAHIYKTFSEIVTSIFGSQGETIALQVLESFEKEYGKDMSQALLNYKNVDFNLILC